MRARLDRPGLGILGVVLVVLLWPVVAEPELRPLVRDMIGNLGSVDEIGLAIALGDYAVVERAAADLKARASAMKKFDLAALNLDSKQDAAFDHFLVEQERAADAIATAAERKDGRKVVMALEQLFQTSCLPCHAQFREGGSLLRPSVVFMTGFITSWRDINLGLAIHDFSLVSRAARDLEATARVLAWDQVIESAFELTDEEERSEFRQLLLVLTAQAARIERGALQQDQAAVTEATRRMWQEACIACHDQFRD